MLHAHAPEEIKHFAKHLLATFLGLLMALGMEQWHERHREGEWARIFLEQIHADLQRNRADLATTRAGLDQSVTNDRLLIENLARAEAARKAGRPSPGVERRGKIREEFRFTTSAWDAAKASGALRYLPPPLLQELSGLFEEMRRLVAIQDQTLASREMDPIFLNYVDDWGTLEVPELRRVREGMRFILSTNQNWIRAARDLDLDLEKDQKAVEEALRKL